MTGTLDAISVDRESPFFHTEFYRYSAWLEGERLESCIAANALEGWAIVYELDDAGRIIDDGKGNAKIKRVHGKIEIKLNT
jgi:hypothetical protein